MVARLSVGNLRRKYQEKIKEISREHQGSIKENTKEFIKEISNGDER
jgi:hypothetical protein